MAQEIVARWLSRVLGLRSQGQVVTTRMDDCQRTAKPSRNIINSAFHPSGVGKLSS